LQSGIFMPGLSAASDCHKDLRDTSFLQKGGTNEEILGL
jgi:hypothetical protein